MQICVLGDLLVDVEVGAGQFSSSCPENPAIPIFKGNRVGVFAGGAGNVCNILRDHKATVSLYCDGPGQGDRAWIGDLAKRCVRANRIVWSNHSSLCLKMRGVNSDNQVVSRIDSDADGARKSGFPALLELLDDIQRYDCVVVSDYQKGFVNQHTEQAIVDIIKAANCSVIDTKGLDCTMYSNAVAICPNQPDAIRIFGTDDPVAIRDMVGCRVVYVTRGASPILMGCKDGMMEISVDDDIAQPYCVGAGDSFAAGLALALGQGKSFIQAGMAAAKMAQAYVAKGRKSPLR